MTFTETNFLPHDPGPVWSPLEAADIGALAELANRIHRSLNERPEVFAEKLQLFPDGCRKLTRGRKLCGYGLTHPWKLGDIPALDDFLRALPLAPDCLFVHDVAVSREVRGKGAPRSFVDYLISIARSLDIKTLALVAVSGSGTYWSQLGFQQHLQPKLARKLKEYGDDAIYMRREL
jgi:GNAT superfamily N-acetyltransferase